MSQLKGACIIRQSGGPASAINASAYGVIRTALDSGCITKVYGAAHGIKGVLDDVLYDMGQEDAKELEYLLYTPSSALGSCRYKLKDFSAEDDSDYQAHSGDVQEVRRALLLLQRRQRLHGHLQQDLQISCSRVGYECRVMGVPKTIDNDLLRHRPLPRLSLPPPSTSPPPAWRYDQGRPRLRHRQWSRVIEIMGRHAGWLTAASSLASI